MDLDKESSRNNFHDATRSRPKSSRPQNTRPSSVNFCAARTQQSRPKSSVLIHKHDCTSEYSNSAEKNDDSPLKDPVDRSRPKSSFASHRYEGSSKYPQSKDTNDSSLQYHMELSRPKSSFASHRYLKDTDESSGQEHTTVHTRPKSSVSRASTCRPQSAWDDRWSISRPQSSYSRSNSSPYFMPNTRSQTGTNYYLYSLAKIYDVSSMRRSKEMQYWNLIVRQRNLGFHSRSECDSYKRYLYGPRTQEYGKTYTSSLQRSQSPSRQRSANSNYTSNPRSKKVRAVHETSDSKTEKNQMMKESKEENNGFSKVPKKQTYPKGLENVEIWEEVDENEEKRTKQEQKNNKTCLLKTIIGNEGRNGKSGNTARDPNMAHDENTARDEIRAREEYMAHHGNTAKDENTARDENTTKDENAAGYDTDNSSYSLSSPHSSEDLENMMSQKLTIAVPEEET